MATTSRSHNGPTSKGATHSVSKRLQQELMSLMMSPSDGVSAFPNSDNFFLWAATIVGPENTPYANLSYKLTLSFPADYPYSAPTVRFTTSIFHPNVDQYGNICLDILKEKWSAIYNVSTILISIQSLLGEPNNDSPLNCVAAELWDDQGEYQNVVRQKYQEATAAADN